MSANRERKTRPAALVRWTATVAVAAAAFASAVRGARAAAPETPSEPSVPSEASAPAPSSKASAPLPTMTRAQANSEDKLLRSPGAPPRTAIDEPLGTDSEGQYFFLHDDNYFSFQTIGVERPRVKFQFSLRFEVVSLRETENFAFNLAFTQKSFWDMLDFDHSSPFIETNYRPEAFFSYRPLRSRRTREIQLGVQHESNGLGAVGQVDQSADSRGWNYVFLDARWGFGRDRSAGNDPWFFFTPGLRVWYPFESTSQALVNAEGYFLAYLDVDFRVTELPKASRVSARLKARRHSFEADVYYPLPALTTGGSVRAWIFGQVFTGEAERMITFADHVTHGYVGLAFQ